MSARNQLAQRYRDTDDDLPVMADVFLFLLVANYHNLRQLLLLHAERLCAAAEHGLEREYDEDVPPPPLVMAKLAAWPLTLDTATGDAFIDDLDDEEGSDFEVEGNEGGSDSEESDDGKDVNVAFDVRDMLPAHVDPPGWTD